MGVHRMKALVELKKSLVISVWFMFLTFPIMVIRVNTIEKIVEWRWRGCCWRGGRNCDRAG